MQVRRKLTRQKFRVIYITTLRPEGRKSFYFQKPSREERVVRFEMVTTRVGPHMTCSTVALFGGEMYDSPEIQVNNGFGTELGTLTAVLRKRYSRTAVYLHTNILCKRGISLKEVHSTARRVSTKPGYVGVA